MINERLKLLLDELELSQRQFALKINLDPGYISRIIQGKVTPPDRILLLIEKVFSVNRLWLETGEGEIFSIERSTLARRQLLQMVEVLDEAQIKAVKVFIKYLQEQDA